MMGMEHGQVYVCVIEAEIEIFIFHGATSLEKNFKWKLRIIDISKVFRNKYQKNRQKNDSNFLFGEIKIRVKNMRIN